MQFAHKYLLLHIAVQRGELFSVFILYSFARRETGQLFYTQQSIHYYLRACGWVYVSISLDDNGYHSEK